MKQLLKSVARRFAYKLCALLPPDRALAALTERFHLERLTVRGQYGNITFSANDRALLPSYAKTGIWAERTNRQLAEFFASAGNKGAYIDVGANVGLTTIPIARHPGICCTAIEPDPTNFRCLSENILANCPHNNVTLRNIAIFSERKRLSLELDEHNLGDHRIRLANSGGILNEQNRKVIAVDALPLDDIPVSDGPLAIKLDVQGAEAFVIRGGRNILGRAGLLIMEVWPYGMGRIGADLAPILDLLRGFHSVQLCPGEDGPPLVTQLPAVAEPELIAYVDRHRNDPSTYMDIVARKAVRYGTPTAVT
jgi:FkbM family methyltransferase